MMSKRQWFVLLTLFIIYLLLGASFFFHIENREEEERNLEEKKQRLEVEDLLRKHYLPGEEEGQNDIFDKISGYCGKPVFLEPNDKDKPLIWDFYHSLFFVITVCTTVGYGNLAPTTMSGRIFMIFYALIGVPVNGILMVNLGEYFGKSFVKLYRRWKSSKMEFDTTRLGLISQIVLYLVPGFTLLIFIPSVIIMIFEGWEYDVAVYYSFVTLSTIGFGDYVAAASDRGLPRTYFTMYKVFLLFWMIIGLGYLVMVMGFISRAYRSKRLHALEHMLSQKIKRTPQTIREEIRNLLHDILLLKVKKVYKDEVVNHIQLDWNNGKRSNSCPDLEIYRNPDSPMSKKRKRALSETTRGFGGELTIEHTWNKSDSELDKIDKEQTFKTTTGIVEQSDFLLRVVNALGTAINEDNQPLMNSELGGITNLSEDEILQSERDLDSFSSNFTDLYNMNNIDTGAQNRFVRSRAFSEVRFPFGNQLHTPEDTNVNNTWFGQNANDNYKLFRKELAKKEQRQRTLSVPNATPISTPRSVLNKIKATFRRDSVAQNTKDVKNVDVEKQSYMSKSNKGRPSVSFSSHVLGGPSNSSHKHRRCSTNVVNLESNKIPLRKRAFSMVPDDPILEQTSIADLFRILSALEPEEEQSNVPKRKLGTACLTPPEGVTPPRSRRIPIRSNFMRRRSSAISAQLPVTNRRFSLTPVTESRILKTPPPPYTPRSDSPASIRIPIANRRFSLRPTPTTSSSILSTSPVQKQIWKSKEHSKET